MIYLKLPGEKTSHSSEVVQIYDMDVRVRESELSGNERKCPISNGSLLQKARISSFRAFSKCSSFFSPCIMTISWLIVKIYEAKWSNTKDTTAFNSIRSFLKKKKKKKKEMKIFFAGRISGVTPWNYCSFGFRFRK